MKTLALIAAALLLAPGVAAAADLTGAWTISTNVADMPFTIVCNMTQTGAVLGGTCGVKDAPDKPSVLTGAADGDSAKWAYDVTFQDMPLHVDFAGVAKGSAMSGTISVLDMPSPFTAVKQ